jgi:hypothetical protein
MPDRMFTVPAGTSPSRCSGSTCSRPIYWVTEPNGRRVPVDCSGPDRHAPSETNDPSQLDAFAAAVAVHDGVGVHHQSVCVNADEFVRAKAGAR